MPMQPKHELEVFENPNQQRDYIVRIEIPEFNAYARSRDNPISPRFFSNTCRTRVAWN